MTPVETPRALGTLRERLRQMEAERSGRRISFFDWAMRVPEAKTGPLDFDRFPFQLELYDQHSADDEEIVVKKATQLGISTWLLRWTMYLADARGFTVLYLFPKRAQMYDFCMPGDEQVLMGDGTRKGMEDVRAGDPVMSVVDGQVTTDTVTRAWCNGIRKVDRLSLRGGRQVRATGNHRLLTADGWKEVSEIRKGDELLVPTNLPEQHGDLSEDDAFLIALWLAEGSKTRAGFTVSCQDPQVRARAEQIAQKRGWNVYDCGKGTFALTARWRKDDQTPAALLREYGLRGMTTATIHAPERVLQANQAAAAEFLRTYIACDGNVGRRETTVASASERMVRDLLLIGARLGLTGTIRSRQPKYPGSLRAWTVAWAESTTRATLKKIGAYSKGKGRGVPSVTAGTRWIEVVKVERAAETVETYDIETEHHAFFVEGCLSHNSDARIRSAIMASPYLRERIPGNHIQNKGLKQIGVGYLYCFTEQTMVLTREGHVPINEIQPGDEVLTHRGRWREVTKVMRRQAPVTVRVRATGSPEIVTTPEHPFWARAKLPPSRRLPWRDRRRFTDSAWTDAADLTAGGSYVARCLPPVRPSRHPSEWWWVVGRYLADGCISSDGYGVEFTCAEHEADGLIEALRKATGANVTNWKVSGTNARRVMLYGREWADRLRPFGRYSHGKHLTGEAQGLGREKAAALLEGWLSGDGHRRPNGIWFATTVSRALALDMAALAQRAYGVVASVSLIHLPAEKQMPTSAGGRLVNQRSQYHLQIPPSNHSAFVDGGTAWKPVRQVKSAGAETVWNIAVAEDESFVADGCIVHNCRGSESKDDLQSIDADALAMDEYDDLRPENIPDAERRISGSPHHLIRRVGVPDIPNQGVDRLYAESDMRRWFVKCEACGTRQHLEWSNVDTKNIRLICNSCHKPRIDVKKGEWVAEHPDRRVRGYHIPRLVVPGVNLRAIVEASQKTNPTEVKTHQNKDLGLAFTPEEGQISLDRIMAAQRSEIRQSYVEHDGRTMGELRTMGVDVASVRALNVRASAHFPDGTKQSLYLGTVNNFEEAAKLMRALDIQMCAVDHLPEGRLARAFAEKFPGRVYLANYSSSQNLVTKIDDAMRTVSVRRTEAIDATFDMIRQQRNRLPGELPDNYVRDLQNLIRTVETDDHGKTKVAYREMGPTDYAHCEVYDLLASEVWWYLKSVDEANRGQIQPLEEMYDFERVELEGGNADYDPGNFE